MNAKHLALGIMVLALMVAARPSAAQSLTITPDPAVYSVFAEAAATWTAAGVPVTVGPGGLPIVVVWWEPGGNLACHGDGVNCPVGAIYVDGYDAWSPAMAAHEIGHALGLSYHRTDQLSCMSSPILPTTPAGPDATDLAALGVTAAGVAVEMETAVETLVMELPNTGTGVGR